MVAYVETDCGNKEAPHTLMYWLHDPTFQTLPVPYELSFDNQQDALDMANVIVTKTLHYPRKSSLLWVKVFRADNEVYECYRWDRPRDLPLHEDAVQKDAEAEMSDSAQLRRSERRSWWKRLFGKA